MGKVGSDGEEPAPTTHPAIKLCFSPWCRVKGLCNEDSFYDEFLKVILRRNSFGDEICKVCIPLYISLCPARILPWSLLPSHHHLPLHWWGYVQT